MIFRLWPKGGETDVRLFTDNRRTDGGAGIASCPCPTKFHPTIWHRAFCSTRTRRSCRSERRNDSLCGRHSRYRRGWQFGGPGRRSEVAASGIESGDMGSRRRWRGGDPQKRNSVVLYFECEGVHAARFNSNDPSKYRRKHGRERIDHQPKELIVSCVHGSLSITVEDDTQNCGRRKILSSDARSRFGYPRRRGRRQSSAAEETKEGRKEQVSAPSVLRRSCSGGAGVGADTS